MQTTKSTDSAARASRRKRRNDLIFIAVILLTVSAAALGLFLFRTVGDTVTVTVDGQIWGEYPLGENRTVEIRTDDGYNLLVIEDGAVYVSDASCPDGICSSHRPIRHDGESIICLPNKVIIAVRTGDTDQPDIIA